MGEEDEAPLNKPFQKGAALLDSLTRGVGVGVGMALLEGVMTGPELLGGALLRVAPS